MNASYAWLRAFVDFSLSPEELRELLTMRCAPVDELTALRADLAPIVVGRVVQAAPHPDSDHLWVTKVDAGGGELLDVVCGAPNVTAGKLYPFARTGTVMPGGLKIEKRKIRGQLSNGMLCSARELGLGADHSGIMELAVDVAPGTPFLQAMPVGDTRLVVDVTPNRPDLLSHLGLAREIAAALDEPLSLPEIPLGVPIPPAPHAEGREGNAGRVLVRVDDAGGAPRYMGVVIRGVRIGPSPSWLRERLEAAGVRSINNVVDATNYILQELGQPTHAFDLARLAGGRIIVRDAAPDEKITTLDGEERTLQPGMTVVADAERPQAIGGIMGGAGSEVTESTTDLFLEVATFDPRRTRATRRALGLSTEASYRFERGVDIELPPAALERAARLITSLAGGAVDGAPVDIYPVPHERPRITLRASRVARLLGERVEPAEIARLLESVGFDVERGSDAGALDVVVPPWRPDVGAEVDLIEEVARLRGYDSFSDELRPFRPGTVPDAPAWLVARKLREALAAAGLLEARPMPFVVGAETGFARVANPLAENEAYLRRELLDSLSRRAEYNLARMQRNLRLFEIGSAFFPTAGILPREELHVALLVMGERRPPHFTEPAPPAYDEWDARALAELVASTGYPESTVELRPAAAAGDAVLWEIDIDGATLGVVRRLTLDAPVWAAPAWGVELSLGEVPAAPVAPPGRSSYLTGGRRAAPPERVRYRPVPVTPAAAVDVALLVPQGVEAAAVERTIRGAGGEMLEEVALFDEYRGKGVPEGYRSLAWRLTFRHPERTLRDKEVEGRRDRILRTLESELGVRQRAS